MAAQKRANRRELILNTAAGLFQEQGYDTTSIRQIADSVGCTEAALYYHFKEGKRELLQQVVECHTPNLAKLFDDCQDAASLEELVSRFGQTYKNLDAPPVQKLRWLMAEFPNLSPEDRAVVQNKQLALHQRLTGLIAQFVGTQEEASALAWIMLAAAMGYGLLFVNFDIQSRADFSVDDMIDVLSRLMAAAER